jgi:hypothetical protein
MTVPSLSVTFLICIRSSSSGRRPRRASPAETPGPFVCFVRFVVNLPFFMCFIPFTFFMSRPLSAEREFCALPELEPARQALLAAVDDRRDSDEVLLIVIVTPVVRQ